MSGQRFSVTVNVDLPNADKRVAVLKVPAGEAMYTIEEAYASLDTALTAGAGTWFGVSLENGGTSGTAQTQISGSAGSTAGWVANEPKQMAITEGSGDLTEGQYLNVFYDQTGSPTPGRLSIMLQVTRGRGGTA